MKIALEGRSRVTWPLAGLDGTETLEIEFDGDGTWHPLDNETLVGSALVAGPDATGNPAGTIVLDEGMHRARIKVTSGDEVILRDAYSVLVGDVKVCWPIDEGCGDWETVDEAVRDRSYSLAANTLRMLTGYQVGGCPTVVRPCAARDLPHYDRYYSPSAGTFMPHINGGNWVNACGCAPRGCSCVELSYVHLPGPVGEVFAVWLDGEQLTPADYIVQGDRVYRVGGRWPVCQDILSDYQSVEGTFAIEYQQGHQVDGDGAYAAGLLAYEFAKACAGKPCALPPTVTSVTRQGLSFTVASEAFPEGLTGIRAVDAYIRRFNPHGLKTPPQVISGDLRYRNRSLA